jgi:anti-sigma regulatory factor (Ser/Thr protein kinase)
MKPGAILHDEMEIPVRRGCHAPVLDRLLEQAKLTGLRACEPEDLRLVVEEVLTNVVKYSGAAEAGKAARVRWTVSASELHLRFEDPGQPFDPLSEDETGLSDDERCDGGMGILLIQALADSISYSRKDGWNCLALSFRAE